MVLVYLLLSKNCRSILACLRLNSYVRLHIVLLDSHSVSRSHKHVRLHIEDYMIIFLRAEGPSLRPKAACRRQRAPPTDLAVRSFLRSTLRKEKNIFFVGPWPVWAHQEWNQVDAWVPRSLTTLKQKTQEVNPALQDYTFSWAFRHHHRGKDLWNLLA